jgi:radical SAM protein with 4Fe4S-binding SPASM domain
MTTTERGLGEKKSLPLYPHAEPARRGRELTNAVRDVDLRWKPTYVVWEITLACDLACGHCGSRAGRARPDELTTTEALDLVRQMAALGTKEVTLIGGEAYLREDWKLIARAITDAGMRCTMTTGGRAMTKERARDVYEAGIRMVSVSVDGLEATHDRLRAVKGSYENALQSMRNLREAGVRVAANTQFSRPALVEIPTLFELLADNGIVAWQVQLTVAMGRAVDEPELLLEPWQVLEVFPMLAQLQERARARRVNLWPGNNIGYFGPYEDILRGFLPRGHMSSCGAGRSTMGLEANGNIKGCPSLPSLDYTGGNVRDHSLKDVWQKADELRFTRDRTVESGLFGTCKTCYYADTCRAGCSWTSTVLFGKPGDNPFCHHRALELFRDRKREVLRKIVDAPGQPFDQGRFEVVVEDMPDSEIERLTALAALGDAAAERVRARDLVQLGSG